MKFIGQHIVDLIARFRSNVYLEDVPDGTVANDKFLGLDSNNKIVKETITSSSGDITGANIDSDGIGLVFTSGDIDFTIAGGNAITTAGSSGGGTNAITINHDDTSSQASVNNSGRTYIQDITLDDYGHVTGLTSATETVTDTNTNQLTEFTLTADSGSNQTIAHGNTLDIAGGTGINTVVGATDTVTVTAVPGEIDHDSLQNFDPNEHFTQANITTVGTIGTGTWEGTAIATDQQKHIMHYQFLGYSIGDGSNYEMPQNLTDGQAPFEHADTSSADGLTIPAGSGTNVSEMIRMGGHVMPRAGTLKKWKGWASCNHNGGNYFVALFKWSPVENDSTDISTSHGGLTMLDEATIVGKTNDKVMPIDETSFTSASVAAGDIIFTQVKTSSASKTVYFNTTLEIEF